ATAAGPVVLASDAVHYYEELERDRPFSTVASLPDMYAAFDQIRELAQDGARVVAGHDPLVAERFPSRAGTDHVIQISACSASGRGGHLGQGVGQLGRAGENGVEGARHHHGGAA